MSNIINNFKTMLNNSNSNNSSTNSKNTESSNFNISPEMLENLLTNFKNSNNVNSEENYSNSSSSDTSNSIDFETILKIKSIMETLNKKDDPRSNLLYSLKPYLRDTRKQKLDQYVNLFKITQVTNLFKNEKGDG